MSTSSAILELSDYITTAFEEGSHSIATFLDLTKAFDCLCPNILTKKLACYNFSEESCALLESYLRDRRQCVYSKGVTSKVQTVKYGVPQGSILGPFLFLIYINDLPSLLNNSNTILYADDTTIISTSKDFQESLAINNVSLKLSNDWLTANRLSLNFSKTQHMIFSLRLAQMDNPASVKFLGVHLGVNLSWEIHIDHLANKLCKSIYCIRNLKNSVSLNILLVAYHALFHSHMSYAVLAWGHSPHAQRIFSLQRRVIRVIANLSYRADCRNQFVKLKVLTFPCLYIFQCLLHVHCNLSNYNQQSQVHSYHTRRKDTIRPMYVRLTKSRHSSNYFSIKFYNVLPLSVRQLNIEQFKCTMKNYLISKSFFNTDQYLGNDFDELQDVG